MKLEEAVKELNNYAKKESFPWTAKAVKKAAGGVFVDAIEISYPDAAIAPVISVQYEKDGSIAPAFIESVKNLLKDIDMDEAEAKGNEANTIMQAPFEKVKDRINCRLRPVLDDDTFSVPFVEGSGMEIVFSVTLSQTEEGIETIKVSNAIMDRYFSEGVTLPELMDTCLAKIKSSRRVEDLGAMLSRMFGFDMPCETEDEDAESPIGDNILTIVTNDSGVYGANNILDTDFLAQMSAERFNGKDFVILPSSAHEVLLVSTENAQDDIATMIQEINRDHVAPKDVLANVPLQYNATEKKVQLFAA